MLLAAAAWRRSEWARGGGTRWVGAHTFDVPQRLVSGSLAHTHTPHLHGFLLYSGKAHCMLSMLFAAAAALGTAPRWASRAHHTTCASQLTSAYLQTVVHLPPLLKRTKQCTSVARVVPSLSVDWLPAACFWKFDGQLVPPLYPCRRREGAPFVTAWRRWLGRQQGDGQCPPLTP